MSKELFNNITIRLAADDESTIDDGLLEKSVFLQLAFSLELDRVVLPAQTDIVKDSSLGELWTDVKPIDGSYEFELATILPYFLPHFDGIPDYSVRIGGNELVVSSRMVQCFYAETDTNNELAYWLLHRCGLPSLRAQKDLRCVHPIPVRTFIAKRVLVEAASAEVAVQNGFFEWIDDLATDVSKLIEAIRAVSPIRHRRLLPVLAASAFPVFYVAVRGAGNEIGIQQFAADAHQTAFRSPSGITGEELARAREFLEKEDAIPVEESSLGLARSYLHHGHKGLAIIQVCIACESILARKYREFLLARGVSKTKYEDFEKDITFSQLLNLHLPTIRDLSGLPNHPQILGQLNWARKRRNEAVHDGEMKREPSNSDVDAAIDAAHRLIEFLRKGPHDT